MRAVWTVLFFVAAVALRQECFGRLRRSKRYPKGRDAAAGVCVCLFARDRACVSSIRSRLQFAFKNIKYIKVPSMVIHGP